MFLDEGSGQGPVLDSRSGRPRNVRRASDGRSWKDREAQCDVWAGLRCRREHTEPGGGALWAAVEGRDRAVGDLDS